MYINDKSLSPSGRILVRLIYSEPNPLANHPPHLYLALDGILLQSRIMQTKLFANFNHFAGNFFYHILECHVSLKCVLGFGGRSLICYISRSIRLFSQSMSFCSGHLQSDHLIFWFILVINTYFSDFISCSLSDAASCSLTMGQRSTVLMTRTGCPFIGLWSKVTQTVSGSSLTKEPI